MKRKIVGFECVGVDVNYCRFVTSQGCYHTLAVFSYILCYLYYSYMFILIPNMTLGNKSE